MTYTTRTAAAARGTSIFPGTGTAAAMLTALGILVTIPVFHHAYAQNEEAAEASDSRPLGGRLERMFARLDTDENGVVSSAEISAQRGEAFDRFDADGDGALTVTEIAAGQEAAREMMRQARAMRSVSRARSYVAADTDGDGALSKAEFSQARSRMFERIDTNDDGDITREEAEQARTAMREMRKHGRGYGRGFGGWHRGGGHD
jgi:Ca2+-binding EF-hand superfamily protein